jgi:hypothetical protein
VQYVYPGIMRIKTIDSMQKEGNNWRVSRLLDTGETDSFTVGKSRGNRLFYRCMIRDARRVEAIDAKFDSKKSRLFGDDFWQAHGAIQDAKHEIAGTYLGFESLAKEIISQSYKVPFVTFWVGTAIALLGAQDYFDLPQPIKNPAQLIGFFTAFVPGFLRLGRSAMRHLNICRMFDKIGIKVYEEEPANIDNGFGTF